MSPYTVLLVVLLTVLRPAWALDVRVSDSRDHNFYMDALTWVLNKSGADYQLIHTEHPASSQVRKVALVKKDQIDVMYAGTTKELEQQLRPIRIPITRGLVGTRLLIINNKYASDYQQVQTLDDLKQYSGILSFGWPEKEIFEAVGLKQEEKLYDEIFVNINQGSRYYFDRGILEDYSELISRNKKLPDLVVESNLLLQYKSAVLFFVNPANEYLANVIEDGFEKGYQDGSYEEFFYNHPLIKRSFGQAQVANRTVIDIPNPFFPEASQAIPQAYWHQEGDVP